MLGWIKPVQAERLQGHPGRVHLHHRPVCLLQRDQDKVLADSDDFDEVGDRDGIVSKCIVFQVGGILGDGGSCLCCSFIFCTCLPTFNKVDIINPIKYSINFFLFQTFGFAKPFWSLRLQLHVPSLSSVLGEQ